MLRIHFTDTDLLNTRVATGPDPQWELVLSLRHLRRRVVPPRYGDWHRDVLARLPHPRPPEAYREVAVDPYWEDIRSSVDGDRALRIRALLDGGVNGLLRSYVPTMRWAPPTLHVRNAVDREYDLRGRGLLLQPSHFCHGVGHLPEDPDAPPVLVHPAAQPQSDPAGDKALARLMGATRAGILIAAGTACTSGELARRVGVSAPTVSHHLSALRDAGLLRTVPHGTSALHVRTRTGSALVNSSCEFR
ncbi:ArsR/SmtB family transcription factor [Streptomyces telluris]|uniref:Helix-turn-helix domain-containing protein n=1 Tax=Streptomyces telluris TaxID=2720021 RepID=A0A9X2LM31_9ACTN|nr:helix-turn-helix domain-containing protein [Streptomyces telluris]MCQ8773732.1 helix-turn-helix domain-containing protein [Streptomyces telluris]NJP79497.1 helix-turn-helix transcriptional regulator [Streptomyces telluris]